MICKECGQVITDFNEPCPKRQAESAVALSGGLKSLAYIYVNINCPECDYVMERIKDGKIIRCTNPDCQNKNIEFKQPQVEIEKAF